MPLAVNFRAVVHALSDALDLVGINEVHHGKRVGIIAIEIAAALGWSKEEQDLILDASLLHDIGVSSTDLHKKLVDEFDWEGSQGHAEFGAHILGQFPPLAHLAPIVRLHHTHWADLPERGSRAVRIANLIFLADRVDVLAAVAMANNALLERAPEIQKTVADRAGELFAPEFVRAFLDVSRKESFWLALETGPVLDYMERISRGAPLTDTSLETLNGVAQLFSHVVDAKSRFTVEHSDGVARIARYLCGVLSNKLNLRNDDCAKVELAGHLHDLGKLRIPDAILDKPGPLTDPERRRIASHAYETYRILSRIPGFEEIAQWASFHHETPDGEGYPFHVRDDGLPVQARLLFASDIFQALAQDRPYRHALPAQRVLDHMRGLVEDGKLDGFVYKAIAANLSELYRLAKPLESPSDVVPA